MRWMPLFLLLIFLLIAPASSTTFTYDKSTGHAPLTVQFSDTTDPVPDSWIWNFGDGGASTERYPSHTYNNSGQYSVVLITVSNGTTDNLIIDGAISVDYEPSTAIADFTYVNTGGNTYSFTSTSVCVPHCTSLAWDFNGDLKTDSTLVNPSYTYSDNKTYNVRLTASNGMNSNIKMRLLTIGTTVYTTIPQPTGTWMSGYVHVDRADTTYDLNDQRIDLPNTTYLKYWLPQLMENNTGFFNYYGFFTSIMKPMTNVFGFWIFLIIWGLYMFAVWIRTQDVTMPLVIGILSMGTFGLLFPKEALPVIIIMFVVCGAVIITKLARDA